MTSAAYYNEIDPFAAQWLRNLIAAGHIAPGEVDERSIEDVTPDDLRGFTQCHFFAGIGVWSHSLRVAGWPDDKPVWTGSCPCQPFSSAGKGDGFDDDRHLWPDFAWLIGERKPVAVFGEQVAAGNANVWFDLVQSDLEGMGYAFGLVPFPAAGIGAPNIRERAYWVAHADMQREPTTGNTTWVTERRRSSEIGRMADANSDGFHRIDTLLQRSQPGRIAKDMPQITGNGTASGLDNANYQRLEGYGGDDCAAGRAGQAGSVTEAGLHMRSLEVNGFWRDADWLLCRDGKWRPVEPGTFPLVDGAAARLGRVEPGVARVASSNRVGRLKGYGNAINAQAAAEFIRAYVEVNDGR
ncbi:DNA cytosine methyltransferase [Klebsiella aerogenes]|uniref:DNA cytosine methyltransferase n=1 Tax=Klebsiella aerogenes TaxID=548 RepID=UPI0007D8B5B9|nr:DNA cytosine methyltransferase [Klebsiella aerogenes]EIW8605145.1 DNA cytosine methyltransferase [Klebsiella aerogenes]OAM83198.1 DNA cytosine methyltransferase [Klebsiella aerogenes]